MSHPKELVHRQPISLETERVLRLPEEVLRGGLLYILQAKMYAAIEEGTPESSWREETFDAIRSLIDESRVAKAATTVVLHKQAATVLSYMAFMRVSEQERSKNAIEHAYSKSVEQTAQAMRQRFTLVDQLPQEEVPQSAEDRLHGRIFKGIVERQLEQQQRKQNMHLECLELLMQEYGSLPPFTVIQQKMEEIERKYVAEDE